MIRERLRRLVVFSISLCVLLSLTFYYHITKLSLPVKIQTNHLQLSKTGIRVIASENVKGNVRNNLIENVRNNLTENVRNNSFENVRNNSVENVQNNSVENFRNYSVENVRHNSLENVRNNSIENVRNNSVENVRSSSIENVRNNSIEYVRNNSFEKVRNNSFENVRNNSVENVQNNSIENVRNNSFENVRSNSIENFRNNLVENVRNNSLLVHVNKSTDHAFMVNTSIPGVSEPPSVTSFVNFTLPKFIKTRPIVFLHIGKNGGTSFDMAIKPIITRLGGRYVGNRHFDWSYIETIPNADVVVLLRDPLARAISHYYFMRIWSKNKLNMYPLSTYLKKPKEMLWTRDCWQDGQASVLWITGTHIANWAGIKQDEVPSRERMSLNISEMCMLAAKRLRSTFWFGIIEDPERSFELLQHQLGWSQKLKFPSLNVNKHSEATENETRILATLMPQDIWLYGYAKVLFEARWTYYKTGVYKQPIIPPIPTLESVPCISTRAILLCKKGPLSPLYYVNPSAHLHEQSLPDEVMKQLKLDKGFFLYSNLSQI